MMSNAGLRSTVLDQLERLESEIMALRCLTGLLNGQDHSNTINLSELSYLIDPIIEREHQIIEKLRTMLTPTHSASV